MKQVFFLILMVLSCAINAQYSTVNQAIPDDGTTATFDMVVSGLPTTIDTNFGLEQICFNMAHPWDNDMDVKLRSPNGRVIVLFSHVGGDGDNFAATCFRADADTGIGSASAPFTGYYRPMGDLGLFNNGQNPNGTWTFIVQDTKPGADQGFLVGWGLAFGGNPARPFPFISSNLPIVKINAHLQYIPNDPKVQADFMIIDNGPGVRNNVKDTAYAFKGKILVEQQGYSGPYYPKKNYDFDLIDAAQNEYDTTLLGMPAENDWILKAEYLDRTLMANSLTYEMCRRMGNYASRTKFCEVLVDDEYMGVYTLTEKVKRSKDRVNVAKLKKEDTVGVELTGGYIFEMNVNGQQPAWLSQYLPINWATNHIHVEFKEIYPKQDSIMPQQHMYIKGVVDSFENSLMRDSIDPNTWRKIASEKSFIDFQIVDEFTINYDSYGRSTYMYKEKATDGNKVHIGPSWDYDRAYPVYLTTGWVWQITHQGWPFPFWWSKFNSDTVYLKKLWCRWTTLRMNTLSNDSFFAYIDSTHSLLQESAARNFERWPELNGANYDSSVNGMKGFIVSRMLWMDANIHPHGAALPHINLTDTSVCANSVIGFVTGNQIHYNWSNGDTVPIITVNQTGVYSVSVKDDYGCSAMDGAMVSIYPALNAGFSKTSISNFNFSFMPVDTGYSLYAWQFGDGNSSSLKSPTHSYAASGNYVITLTVTDAHGCVDVASDTISVIAGIFENEFSTARVYPNPFSDDLNVEFSDLEKDCGIRLKDIAGRSVQEMKPLSSNTKISTTGLEAGTYFVELWKAGKRVKVLKVTRQ